MAELLTAPLGLLGGTFDPVHKAHLALARAAMKGLSLEGVRWIPSGRPGHRGQPGAPVEDRLAMLRIALANEEAFSLDCAEAESTEPTYTIHTLARIRGEIGHRRPLAFIIGADQLLALDTWREWRRLFESAHIAVAERPGYPVARDRLSPELAAELAHRESVSMDGQAAGRILRFTMPPLDISASAIRAALNAGQNPPGVLPPGVLDYIRSRNLYRNTGF